MNNAVGSREKAAHSRRYPRVRVPAPFPCSFARVGLKKWLTPERKSLGVVYDVSEKGARVMSEAAFDLGDQIAINLSIPNQAASTFVDLAIVRWGREQTFGVEFESLSQVAAMRLRKFIQRQALPKS
jgi:hypothetical protein